MISGLVESARQCCMSMRRVIAAETRRARTLDTGHVPVTRGLAPAPSLSEALLRECRDMGPTLESRVSGPLGRHGVLVWAGCGRILTCYVMLVTVNCSLYVYPLQGWAVHRNNLLRGPVFTSQLRARKQQTHLIGQRGGWPVPN